MDSQTGPLEQNVDIDAFFRNNILGTQVVLVLDFLLYGAYTVLFGICIHILLLRRRRHHNTYTDHLPAWIFQLTTTCLLFALATSSVILDASQACADLLFRFSLVAGQGEGEVIRNLVKVLKLRSPNIDAIYIIANAIADSILIYRCYIIWGNNKRIVFLPTLVSIGNTAFALYLVSTGIPNSTLITNAITSIPTAAGKASAATNMLEIQPLMVTVFLIVNIASNVFLTGMIAGKIWWIRRSVDKLMGAVSPNAGMYRTALAIILESGLSYPIALAITFGFQMHHKEVLICTLPNQIVGIAPTLILVRTGLGLSAEPTTVQETLASLRCADGRKLSRSCTTGGSGNGNEDNQVVSVSFRTRRRSLLSFSESDFSEELDLEARDLGGIEGNSEVSGKEGKGTSKDLEVKKSEMVEGIV